MTINVHSNAGRQYTCVSNTFIDRYMTDADGEYVKIYLYLLRSMSREGSALSMSALCDRLGHTEHDVRKCLAYWAEKGLLRLEYDDRKELVGICMLDPEQMPLPKVEVHVTREYTANEELPADSSAVRQNSAAAVPVRTAAAEAHTADAAPQKNDPAFSPEERETLLTNAESKELVCVAEGFLKKTLSQRDVDTVLFWHWTLGLSVDLIEYLIEQCANSGHASIRYMNAVALSWKDSGIRTEEEARNASDIHSRLYYKVMHAFGISGRKLNTEEEARVRTWTKEYGMSDEMIEEACSRAVRNTGRVNFDYADRILSSWHAANIRSLSDVERADREHRSRPVVQNRKEPAARPKSTFMNFSERSYDDSDYEALELKLMQK